MFYEKNYWSRRKSISKDANTSKYSTYFFFKTPVKIDFKEEVFVEGDIKLKTKATPSKILRGRMVNYMARNNVEDIEQLKKFSCDGYNYSEDYSDINKLVFVKSKVFD